MSNRVNFSLNEFSRALSVVCAKTEDKCAAMAEWLGGALETAAKSWLLDGSDALRQVLSKLETSGKSSNAVKLRKVLRSIEFAFTHDSLTYGNVSGFNVVPSKDLLGGNSPRCEDHGEREAACELYGEKVRLVAGVIFAPAVRDSEADPLASFGNFSEKTIALKLASASDSQLTDAVTRLRKLSDLVVLAIAEREAIAEAEAAEARKSEAEKAAAEAAAAAAAAVEAEKAQATAAGLTTRASRTSRVSPKSETEALAA